MIYNLDECVSLYKLYYFFPKRYGRVVRRGQINSIKSSQDPTFLISTIPGKKQTILCYWLPIYFMLISIVDVQDAWFVIKFALTLSVGRRSLYWTRRKTCNHGTNYWRIPRNPNRKIWSLARSRILHGRWHIRGKYKFSTQSNI